MRGEVDWKMRAEWAERSAQTRAAQLAPLLAFVVDVAAEPIFDEACADSYERIIARAEDLLRSGYARTSEELSQNLAPFMARQQSESNG